MAVWLWNFWIFSFWGWCLERLFAAVTHSPRQRRRCLLVSPLCPVYGLGMAAVRAHRHRRGISVPLVGRLLSARPLLGLYQRSRQSPGAGLPALFSGMGATDVPGGKAGRPGSRRAGPAGPAAPHLAVPDELHRRRGVFPPLSGRHPRSGGPAAGHLGPCQLPVDRIPAMGACPSRGFLLEFRYRKHKGDCYGTQ